MPLSESALREIRSELSALHELQVKVNERVKALEAILVPFDFTQAALPFRVSHPPAQHGEPSTNGSKEAARNPYASTGLRAAILEVLQHHGPMRAPEIAAALERKGFANDSSTPLTTRVYNDAWRMTQRDIVENKDGAFSLK